MRMRLIFFTMVIVCVVSWRLIDWLHAKGQRMNQKIVIWDNDGTIMGSRDPNDTADHAKVILPGVETMMNASQFNCVISGLKSPESEAQNFDPDKITEKFINLMEKLPIKAVAFSPMIGGIACYVVIKRPDASITIKKAHEEQRYQRYIGEFKKPGIGMFVVMRDIALEEFGLIIDADTSLMIGDMWHDEAAATDFGIPFVHAHKVHEAYENF